MNELISITERCSEDWNKMSKKNGHNFCKTCSKCVIDFTDYSTADIISTLSSSSSEVCGRLTENQLSQLNYHLVVSPVNRNWMKYLGVLAIGVSVFTLDVNAASREQPKHEFENFLYNKNIKAEDLKIFKTYYGYMFIGKDKPAVGLKLRLKGSNITTITDKNGRYEFKVDDNFDRNFNTIVIENSAYKSTFILNFSVQKQTNFYPSTETIFVLGKIIYTPKKGNKFL